MKKQKNIIIAGLILLIGAWVWYVWSGSKPEVVQQVEQANKPTEQAAKKDAAAEKPEKKIVAKNIAAYMASPDADPSIIKRIKKVQKFQSLKTAEFSYYGKVIDQHGDPVVGASVQVDIGYYPFIPNGNFYPSHKILSLVTDAEGRFSIVGEKGESVRIDPIPNSEYDFSYPDLFALTFSRVGIKGLKKISNPDKPVIFHAWKKTEAANLYYGEIFQKFQQDGQFHSVDIPALNGTMEVAFIIDPAGTSNAPLDWTVKLQVEGGGVVETSDTFMNQAPLDDYTPQWSASYKRSEPHFSEWGGKRKFYIKGLNGSIYARMEVEFIAYYNDVGVVDARYWLNPNGSRNLQDDPKKRIYPK